MQQYLCGRIKITVVEQNSKGASDFVFNNQ